MTVIFKAKTTEAHRIKVLTELLYTNIKTGCFIIDEHSISLKMMDSQRRILINLSLEAENFVIYKFNSNKLYIGLNLNHLHRILRTIKKKDVLEFIIDNENINELTIKIYPKDNNRVVTSGINIQTIQNLDIDLPELNGRKFLIPSTEVQKMLKDFGNLSNVITISATQSLILFKTNAGGVLKRCVEFGNKDDDIYQNIQEYSQEFNTDQLYRISKIAGLSSNIQIQLGKPIKFSSNIGTLGKISIFIKSKEEIEAEKYLNEIQEYEE